MSSFAHFSCSVRGGVAGACFVAVLSGCASPEGARGDEGIDETPRADVRVTAVEAPNEAATSERPQNPSVPVEGKALEAIVAGRAKAEAGDHAGALAAFQTAIDLAPTSGLAHLEWARTAQMGGVAPDRIRLALDAAIRLAPQNPRAHFERALFAEAEGRTENAVEGYRTTLRFRRDHARARARLGTLRLKQGDAKAAVESLRLAVELDRTAIPPRMMLAEAAEALGDIDLAERTLRGLVDEFPVATTWRRRLIALYDRHGRKALAKAERVELAKIDPQEKRKLRPLKKRRRRRRRKR